MLSRSRHWRWYDALEFCQANDDSGTDGRVVLDAFLRLLSSEALESTNCISLKDFIRSLVDVDAAHPAGFRDRELAAATGAKSHA